MPLSVNVGLSRKASKDYQSTGVSINVTAELDQSLLAKPDELQQQIGDLYAQAESALDRQANRMSEPPRRRPVESETRPARTNGRYPRNGNGHARNGNGDGRMTDSQRKAIQSIAERQRVDLDAECREIIGAEFDDLTLRQASELIDHLKSLAPERSGR